MRVEQLSQTRVKQDKMEYPMEKMTDWLKLWADLARIQIKKSSYKKKDATQDVWKDRARNFDKLVQKKWEHRDSSREFIISTLRRNPGSTVLDIGAGTGAWSLLMAEHAARVTALDPSEAMTQVLQDKIRQHNIDTITILNGTWPAVSVEPHDYVLASHSMYGDPDFQSFIEKMTVTAKKSCFLVMRVPFTDTIMAKAAMKIWGQPHDSPNFQIAYNALLQMGIYPNVLMESSAGWSPWSHDSLEDALDETKRRFGLQENTEHDAYLTGLLKKELKKNKGRYVWPVGNQAALVYWEIGEGGR